MINGPDSAHPDFQAQWRSAPRKRTRDPVTGYLRPRRCHLYFAGHEVHWIQANHSAKKQHRRGVLALVDDNMMTVDFGDELKRYRNCDPARLLEIVGLGNPVDVCEEYAILKSLERYAFSIADADQPWVACEYSPLTPASPEVRHPDAGAQIEIIATGIKRWFGADLIDRSDDIDDCAGNISEDLQCRREQLMRYGKQS